MHSGVLLLLCSTLCMCFGAMEICDMCSSHTQSGVTEELLKTFCINGSLRERCCVKNNSNALEVIAVDWSNCNLSSIPLLTSEQKSSIQWIAVNENHNISVKHSQLRDLLTLATLVLPANDSCEHCFGSSVVKKGVNICTQPIDGCNNVTCPMNSHCAPDGPGLSMCLCNDGWHSYRCLKKDGFPAVQWLVGFAVTTVVICVSLRLAQNRWIANAKK